MTNTIDTLISKWVNELHKGSECDTILAHHIEELRAYNKLVQENTN